MQKLIAALALSGAAGLVAPAALDETEAWCRESFKHVCAGVATCNRV